MQDPRNSFYLDINPVLHFRITQKCTNLRPTVSQQGAAGLKSDILLQLLKSQLGEFTNFDGCSAARNLSRSSCRQGLQHSCWIKRSTLEQRLFQNRGWCLYSGDDVTGDVRAPTPHLMVIQESLTMTIGLHCFYTSNCFLLHRLFDRSCTYKNACVKCCWCLNALDGGLFLFQVVTWNDSCRMWIQPEEDLHCAERSGEMCVCLKLLHHQVNDWAGWAAGLRGNEQLWTCKSYSWEGQRKQPFCR